MAIAGLREERRAKKAAAARRRRQARAVARVRRKHRHQVTCNCDAYWFPHRKGSERGASSASARERAYWAAHADDVLPF